MTKSKSTLKNTIVNKYKLIYIPLIILLIAIVTVSITIYYVSKNLLLQQMKQDGLNLTKQITTQLKGNATSLEVINELLEDKIRVVGNSVILNKKYLNNQFLSNMAKELNVDELNWMDKNGKILYSNNKEYIGWFPPKNHPLYNFILSNKNDLIEKIRPASISGNPIKLGSIKTKDGSFIQVGILAANIQKLTNKFSYQSLVKALCEEDNIIYSFIIDKNLKTVAAENIEDILSVYKYDESLKKSITDNINMTEWYYNKINSKVLNVSVPILINEKTTGTLTIGFSMKNVYYSIYIIFMTFGIIVTIMFFVFLWIQNKNIVKPVNQLNNNINKIDLENNIDYRLPLIVNDTFLGLAFSINNLLDKAYEYFHELNESKKKLNASNEEISATYQQLLASEEALQVQYDEIQCYTQNLENLKQKYEIVIKCTNIAIWEIDIKDDILHLSKEVENIIGTQIKEKENIYEALNKFLTTEDREKLINQYIQYKHGDNDEIYIQLQITDNYGKLKWILIHGRGIYNKNKESKLINGILLDITKLKEQEEYIEHLAYHDHLTGLPNRLTFIEKFKEELSNNKSGAVILLDLDNFKAINDTLGHVYGDSLLKKVAEELMSIQDEKLLVSRFGGDEFLILVKGENDILEIDNYAKKIINIFKKKLIIETDEIHMKCSMGITLYPSDSNEINQLIMNADMAMYKVKYSGKNNYIFFNEEMTEHLKNKIKIEKILSEALIENGFKLLYQPQVCTHTGEIVGFEALLRLKNHNLSPALFIPLAEETGMISEIGRWVTKEVVQQIATWQEKGLQIKPIAINFSVKQLNDLNYFEFLQDVLKENNVDAKYIDIEITENIFLEKKHETVEFLNKLKLLGVKISLDDFGTGYSSLSYLTFLPVDKIKLDKALSDRFLDFKENTVINNLISLAHSLKLKVVAEGIENIEQLNRLKEGNCDYIQGYIFSKPLSIEDAEKVYDHNFLEKLTD